MSSFFIDSSLWRTRNSGTCSVSQSVGRSVTFSRCCSSIVRAYMLVGFGRLWMGDVRLCPPIRTCWIVSGFGITARAQPFLTAPAMRLHTIMSVGWSVGPLSTFLALLSFFSSLLLLKYISELYHCSGPLAHDWGSHVPALFNSHFVLFILPQKEWYSLNKEHGCSFRSMLAHFWV